MKSTFKLPFWGSYALQLQGNAENMIFLGDVAFRQIPENRQVYGHVGTSHSQSGLQCIEGFIMD